MDVDRNLEVDVMADRKPVELVPQNSGVVVKLLLVRYPC